MHQRLIPNAHDIIHDDIHELIKDDEKKHLFDGAHFLLEDNGLYFSKWKGLPGVKIRVLTSHQSETEQYCISGEILQECLFSTRKINGVIHTWFQLERYPADLSTVHLHIGCLVTYVWSGKNIGPHGSSHYTESHPLVLQKDRIQEGAKLKINL